MCYKEIQCINSNGNGNGKNSLYNNLVTGIAQLYFIIPQGAQIHNWPAKSPEPTFVKYNTKFLSVEKAGLEQINCWVFALPVLLWSHISAFTPLDNHI